jgi:transposase
VSRVWGGQRRGEGSAMDRLKDLPVSGQTVELWWRKRRLVCGEALCPRRTFTLTSAAVLPRARVTERLRHRVARAIASSNRAVSDVAREYGVSWPTAHKRRSSPLRPDGCPNPSRLLGWESMRPDSDLSVGSSTASPGGGPIRG